MIRLVIFFLYLLCLSRAESGSGQALRINRKLLKAIQYVESGGDSNAVGDNGRSLGPYQISEAYYQDAVQFNPSLADNGRTYENVFGPASSAYSEAVIRSYMRRYATPERLGHWPPTNEDIARIHNGGPNGFKRRGTDLYWDKVNDCLQNPEKYGLSNDDDDDDYDYDYYYDYEDILDYDDDYYDNTLVDDEDQYNIPVGSC